MRRQEQQAGELAKQQEIDQILATCIFKKTETSSNEEQVRRSKRGVSKETKSNVSCHFKLSLAFILNSCCE